jgi:hypothetical protein
VGENIFLAGLATAGEIFKTIVRDDAAQLRQENDDDERADNMDRAASMLTWMLLTHPAYASGVQPSDGGRP